MPASPRREEEPRPAKAVAPTPRGALPRARPAAEAWARIAEPLRRRKGIRVLFFGVTGKGKTHGVADFLDFVVERNLIELVLIHDVKKPEAQYAGDVIHEATAIYTDPPAAYPAVRVMRRRGLDHTPSVDGAARVALEAGYEKITTMLVIDEFSRALTDNGKWDAPNAERVWCEGADFGVSGIATKQLPQYTPTTATAQSALVIFGQNGKGASFFPDEDFIPASAADILTRLPERQFILVPYEGDFDGTVYEVPIR